MRFWKVMTATAALILTFSISSYASTIGFTMEGQIVDARYTGLDPFSGEANIDTEFTVTFMFDLNAPNVANVNQGRYRFQPTIFQLNIGSLFGESVSTGVGGPENRIVVSNDISVDAFSAEGRGFLLDNVYVASSMVSLSDSTMSAFNDVSLPASLNIDNFDALYLSVNGQAANCNGNWGCLIGEITSIQTITSPAPLPATIWLFSSGFIYLVGFGRRNIKYKSQIIITN